MVGMDEVPQAGDSHLELTQGPLASTQTNEMPMLCGFSGFREQSGWKTTSREQTEFGEKGTQDLGNRYVDIYLAFNG